MTKGFIVATTKHFQWTNWVALVALCILSVMTMVFSGLSWPYYELHRERFVWTGIAIFLAMIAPPVIRMARRRDRFMLYVAVWGIASTCVVLFGGYASFYLYVGDSQNLQLRYQPILALGPVVSGLVFAAIGWYVHYQKTAKDQRTAAAVKILMDTRLSAEFLRFQRDLRAVYPPRSTVSVDDAAFFPPAAAKLLDERILKLARETEASAIALLSAEIAKLRALDALGYLLNLYEFVAQGVRAGDLDEDLLYETISSAVLSLHSRGTAYMKNVKSHGEPLAFQHLDCLVANWSERLRLEEADFLNARSRAEAGQQSKDRH